MNIVLWVLQVLLGIYFLFIGVTHFIVPPGLPAPMSWMYELPTGLHIFSGAAEILGGLGLILPGLTKRYTYLTPLAALGLILVRAMIAAARADGRLDAQESQVIFQRIESLKLDPDAQALLVAEMGRPVDMYAIVNSAENPELAAEIYLASRLAIDVDTAAEKSYLAMLAARLKLPPELVTELNRQVEAQTIPEA